MQKKIKVIKKEKRFNIPAPEKDISCKNNVLESMDEFGFAVTDNTPDGYKIDLTVYNKMREVFDYYLWLKESPAHEDLQIKVGKPVSEFDQTTGYLRVDMEHFDMWNNLLHTRFSEEMAKVDVYEIYPLHDKLAIDMSFNNLYVPI